MLVQPAENPFKTKFSYMSVMKNQFKNAKSQFVHAKIPSENPKTQFDTKNKVPGLFLSVYPGKLAKALAQFFGF